MALLNLACPPGVSRVSHFTLFVLPEPFPVTNPAAAPLSPPVDAQALADAIAQASAPFRQLVDEVGKVVVGQAGLVEAMVVGLLGNGHLLIEGPPGLAKTTAIATLARGMSVDFQRLQFTPDLLPADIIGSQVYRPQTQEFVVNKGPIFSNLILADEINRAPAKVQAALLEAMQERQVTIGHETFKLADPFIVMATQNPIEQEGTYPLPEAQMDRFMMKLRVDYPTRDEELAILDRMSGITPTFDVQPVVTAQHLATARPLIDQIHVAPEIRGYLVDLVMATRDPKAYRVAVDSYIEAGASPRATLSLAVTARVRAFLAGRGYVLPEDVKTAALPVLRHRLILSYEAEAEGLHADDVVKKILDTLAVP